MTECIPLRFFKDTMERVTMYLSHYQATLGPYDQMFHRVEKLIHKMCALNIKATAVLTTPRYCMGTDVILFEAQKCLQTHLGRIHPGSFYTKEVIEALEDLTYVRESLPNIFK